MSVAAVSLSKDICILIYIYKDIKCCKFYAVPVV